MMSTTARVEKGNETTIHHPSYIHKKLGWLLGGFVALCGALTVAELAASLPRSGGDYVYLYEGYGPLAAFLSGWVSFLIGFGGPIALSAFAAAKYLLVPLHLDESIVPLAQKGVATLAILAFAVLVLGILQIGAAPILIPVTIWIWATTEFMPALLITIYLIVVGLADNVLKPMLMGRGLNTPMLVIFIGVLGGTLAHGIVGLFIGPIILAVAWELMMAWIREDQTEATPVDAGQGTEKATGLT